MGVQYTRTGGGRTDGSEYLRMAGQVQTIIEEEMLIAGAAGEAEGKAYIGLTGTDREWSGPFNTGQGVRTHSNIGRIDTGQMQKAFTFRVARGIDISLDVGWPGVWQTYFGAQDQGFSAGGFRPSQSVEGMGVLAHLHVYMRVKVDEALDRAEARIVNGL